MSTIIEEMTETLPLMEPTTPHDRYFNYCWWPYEPVASTSGKLRPITLLNQSFAIAGMPRGAFDIVAKIQQEIGLFRTVYGIKQFGGRWGWEFYFYDYQRRGRDVSITRVLKAIAPDAVQRIGINERLPYFMFSLDLDDELARGERTIDVVHMYVGNPGSSVSSGIAYAMTGRPPRLENFYFFFDAKQDLHSAAEKICCSPRIDGTRMPADVILRREFIDCHTICVANKQDADTAYFSGVRVDQLLYFLEWLQYPREMLQFVKTHRNRLDHLLYDVGFDYRCEGEEMQVLKSGFYGVF